MEKRLSPAALIPEDLYVTRGADRQLKKVISSMGRPGYILVSRQMGKTSLLLHAKRELENNNIRFGYIDLSNRVSSSRECFRMISDTLLSCFSNDIDGIKECIRNIRRDSTLQPHREHLAELLEILRFYAGIIVVILDEIDALTASEYSDEVFAQIRSVYFARVSHPELQRITYILSGVVEPTQLIKDRTKSPFNIGEKIYLDDFSYEEYLDFVGKTRLPFSDTVKKSVYDWVAGHPRMTWDLCSELEDIHLSGKVLELADVDASIQKLYLRSYDLPPVDHIRELVRSDSILRQAIKHLRRGEISSIDDKVKRKLYLAGVIRADTGDNNIYIKNQVISEALSTQWIDSMEDLRANLISKGDTYRQLRDYSSAIKCYKEFLEYEGSITSDAESLVFSLIADCYLGDGDVDKALENYLKCKFEEKSDASNYFKMLLQIGICRFSKQEFELAEQCFSEIIRKQKKSIVSCKALLNYAGCLVHKGGGHERKEALQIYRELLDSLKSVQFDDINELNDVHVLAFYNSAQLMKDDDDIAAKKYYHDALAIGIARFQPAIYLDLIQWEHERLVKLDLLLRCHEIIIEQKLGFDTPSKGRVNSYSESILGFNGDIFVRLLVEAVLIKDSVVEAKYLQMAGRFYPNYPSSLHMLCDIGWVIRNTNADVALELGRRVLKEISATKGKRNVYLESLANRLIGICKLQLEHLPNPELIGFANAVMQSNNFDKPLRRVDCDVLSATAMVLRDNNDFLEALEIANFLTDVKKLVKEECMGYTVVAEYIKAQLLADIQFTDRACECAKKALSLISEHEDDFNRIIPLNSRLEVKSNVLKMANGYFERPLFPPKIVIGRNDQCPCGSKKKYKQCCGKSRQL